MAACNCERLVQENQRLRKENAEVMRQYEMILAILFQRANTYYFLRERDIFIEKKLREQQMKETKQRLLNMISYLFGKYDMRGGKRNQVRMQSLYEFCVEDLEKHPALLDLLYENQAMEFFVIQSIMEMMPAEEKGA